MLVFEPAMTREEPSSRLASAGVRSEFSSLDGSAPTFEEFAYGSIDLFVQNFARARPERSLAVRPSPTRLRFAYSQLHALPTDARSVDSRDSDYRYNSDTARQFAGAEHGERILGSVPELICQCQFQ